MQAPSLVARLNTFYGIFPLYVWLEIGLLVVTAVLVSIGFAVLNAIVADDPDNTD